MVTEINGKHIFEPVMQDRSRSRKELHHFGGAGTVTRCGSGFLLEQQIFYKCLFQFTVTASLIKEKETKITVDPSMFTFVN
jgi:hypothetical protein